MLPKRLLNSLTRNEIIALCSYFDIDFEVYSTDNSVLCVANKYVLIDRLRSRKFDKKIIYTCVDFKREPLKLESKVIFGQFSKKNKHCKKIMRQLGLKFNSEIYAAVHKCWSSGTNITYKMLPEMVHVTRTRINRKISRNEALRQFKHFVDSL